MNEMTKRPRKTKNKIWAMFATNPTNDPKPSIAAKTELIKKVAGYCNISGSLRLSDLNQALPSLVMLKMATLLA
jgi:hypothetical protein